MKPLWISHRGFTANAIENSIQAFSDAVSRGFTALETDLRISSDGHIVLHHDATFLDKFGKRAKVASLSREELTKSLSHIGFFDEFIEEFQDFEWTFDIKPESGDQVIDVLSEYVRRRGLLASKISHARYVTWRYSHLAKIQRLFPNAKLYALEAECWRAGAAVLLKAPWLAAIRAGTTYALPPRFAGRCLFDRKIVEVYRDRGAFLVAMLPQTTEDASAAVDAGFDEILSNDLLLSRSNTSDRR